MDDNPFDPPPIPSDTDPARERRAGDIIVWVVYACLVVLLLLILWPTKFQ